MSILIVDKIVVDDRNEPISVTELGHRVIKNYRQNYTGGSWNPDTNYNWVPGMYYDYVPASASSRLRVSCNIPVAGVNAAHCISHWIFYANGTEQGRHGVSGQHHEDRRIYTWDIASWGTSSGRVGYQSRSYANDNHEVRVFVTRYFDGGGSGQNCYGQFVIEEYIPGV